MWTGSGPRTLEKFIEFNDELDREPTVHVGIVGLDASRDANLRVNVTVGTVTRSGFTVHVATWANTKLALVNVRWLAIAP